MQREPSPTSGEAAVDESGFELPLAFMLREQFKKGEYLFKLGEPAGKLFYIASGSIRLIELGLQMKAGQVIGEMGIFSPDRSRTASALVEEDVEVYTLGREEVRGLMSRDPGLATRLIEMVLKRMMSQLKAEIEARERINAELRIARNIQSSMLPRLFPPFPNRKDFEIYAIMEPAKEVGGDFYDFFLLEENKLCVVVGDVSGKGVPAALLMALSKTLLRSEAMQGYPTNEIVARVNNALCADNQECMFLTVLCLILNTRTGEAQFCSGGHNPPLARFSDGAVRFLDVEPGLLVGFEENYRWESKAFRLKPGDIVFLYTDGVTEAENAKREFFSEERFQASVSASRSTNLVEIVNGIRQDIGRHTEEQSQSDDITLLALRFNGWDSTIVK
jgi:sigma-B regulation protein RsbU (phosphoserine phosphatase)